MYDSSKTPSRNACVVVVRERNILRAYIEQASRKQWEAILECKRSHLKCGKHVFFAYDRTLAHLITCFASEGFPYRPKSIVSCTCLQGNRFIKEATVVRTAKFMNTNQHANYTNHIIISYNDAEYNGKDASIDWVYLAMLGFSRSCLRAYARARTTPALTTFYQRMGAQVSMHHK